MAHVGGVGAEPQVRAVSRCRGATRWGIRCAGLVVLIALAVPRAAHADAGEVGLGVVGAVAWPFEGRLESRAEVGLNDWLALRLDAGCALRGTGRLSAVDDLQIVALYDVVSWVPEVHLGAGSRIDGRAAVARILAGVGLRRYLGPSFSVGGQLDAEWRPATWLVVLSIAARWQLE